MSIVCCACQQQLSSESNKRNIFRDDLVIRSDFDKVEGTNDLQGKMKLHSGIELITGHKIFETGGSTSFLCDPCFQKLEGFMNFRAQLLSSFGIIFNGKSLFNPLKQNSPEAQTEKLQDSPKNSDFDYLVETSDCPKLPDRKLAPDDLINVDENSTSLDFEAVRNDEDETNDSTNCSRLQNDQENNNLNDSDSSNDNIDVQYCEDSPARVQDNDIESEIDVCSGEDDEVLEMEDKNRKANMSEVQSSSESEIEVCDYEPTGKRIKNVNALSQPVPF